MAESLAEVLQCRAWNRALFTTYSLSLTFFESVILRLPRQSGCREIWVVADDGHIAGECREANNVTVFHGVYCGAPM